MENRKDRAKGALFGAFIGEALGVGPHWYYDLDELKSDFGDWIDDYTTPKKGRYHDKLKAGELSQQGWIVKEMARYLIDNNGYSDETFTNWMDHNILPHVSHDALQGVGGYTSQMMRQLYQARIIDKKNWNDIASIADTTESLERNIPVSIYYANDIATLSHIVAKNTALTQSDNLVGSLSVAFNLVLALLIQGEPLDQHISKKLMKLVYQRKLPFFAVTSENLGKPLIGRDVTSTEGLFASPDAILSPSHMAQAAFDPDIKIEPAWKAAIVYGMPCAIYHMLPAAYYLSARFHNDFESGVLHAINGGGQNQIRAMLTGALIGAQVGFSNIPKRFINGLIEKEELLSLAEKLIEHL
jgi:ADP-ribosylglycohydrolase